MLKKFQSQDIIEKLHRNEIEMDWNLDIELKRIGIRQNKNEKKNYIDIKKKLK